jgi:mRNA interferase RelE/StbE
MTYEVLFSTEALKQHKMMERTVQERIIAVLERTRTRPGAHLIKLVGDPGYKLRVGDHRIIVDIDVRNLRILVLKVGHRKSVHG